MKVKYLVFSAIVCLISAIMFVRAEQGDYATLGWNMPSGYSFWRVDSTGHFKPGAASTYNIGSAALPVATVYAGTLSGAAITGAATLSATAITGVTSITSPLYVATGPIRLYSRTKAQILAIATSAIGDSYYCSDCTSVTVCVSTAVAGPSFVKVDDKSAACD
jgi:hypothetical protein